MVLQCEGIPFSLLDRDDAREPRRLCTATCQASRDSQRWQEQCAAFHPLPSFTPPAEQGAELRPLPASPFTAVQGMEMEQAGMIC